MLGKREAMAKCQPDGAAKTVKQRVQSASRNTSDMFCCKQGDAYLFLITSSASLLRANNWLSFSHNNDQVAPSRTSVELAPSKGLHKH